MLGIVLMAIVIALAVSALSGILIPLVVAIIVGTLLEPLTGWFQRRRLPLTLAVVATMVVALAIGAGVVWLVVRGFTQQIPEITRQVTAGWQSLVDWVHSLELDAHWLDQLRSTANEYLAYLGQGLLGGFTSTLYTAISFVVGTFFAIFFLFFVLRDAQRFAPWIARVSHLDPEIVREVDVLARQSLRSYFRGIALTAIITAPIFMIPLILLKVPLVLPIFILYFFLSFIPYVGAWITGAFAILIAFGSGGASVALIVGVSLIISNGTIQNVVSSWALGAALKMHPVAVLLVTIVGGTIAGIVGMVLGPPLLAVLIRSSAVIRRHRMPQPS